MYAVRPETADGAEHFQPFFGQVAFIACIGGVIVDCVRDRTIAVDFLESDFPFIVALHAGEGHHRIQRALQPLLLRIMESARQLVVTVFQEIAGNFRLGNRQVERHAVSFRIPVGSAAVFLAGEAFRSDVQALIFAVISREQLEQVETDALLRFVISADFDIRQIPTLSPQIRLFCFQFFETLASYFGGVDFFGSCCQLVLRMIAARRQRHVFL